MADKVPRGRSDKGTLRDPSKMVSNNQRWVYAGFWQRFWGLSVSRFTQSPTTLTRHLQRPRRHRNTKHELYPGGGNANADAQMSDPGQRYIHRLSIWRTAASFLER